MITEKFDAADASDVFFDILAEFGTDKALYGGKLDSVREKLEKYLPERYFPDIYVETDLEQGTLTGAAVAFDSFDWHRIEYEGADPAGVMKNLPAPQRVDDVTGFDQEGRIFLFTQRPFPSKELADKGAEAFFAERGIAATEALCELTKKLVRMPGKLFAGKWGDEIRLIYAPDEPGDARRFVKDTSFREKAEQFIAEGLIPEKAAEALRIRRIYHIPYLREGKFGNGLLKITVGYFAFIVRDGKIAGYRMGIQGTAKCAAIFGRNLKRFYTTQWHITDMCDQRCRHCYLFGQDPAIACFSTPYDKLILTLDKLEKNAAAHDAMPLPVLTGGDPILHPRFWEFAEEIHRRGYAWEILGNPFHLTEEVCNRLYDLGCIRYQLSLDGREAFHDKLRKPGSYRATLEAVPILMKSGIKATFMATASKENLEDILAAMDIAAEVGAELFGFARYCATSPEMAKKLYPSPEEYHDFLLRYYEKREAFIAQGCKTQFALKEHLFTLIEWEKGKFIPEKHEGEPIICDGCHLGQDVCILPNGDMMACRRMPSVVGNVWKDAVYEVTAGNACGAYAAIKDIKKCRDCELLEYCRGCRAVGYNATGDLQGEDPMCWYKPDNKEDNRK